MAISGVSSPYYNLRLAAVADDGSAGKSDSDKEKIASGITDLAKAKTGWAQAVQEDIDRLKLGDKQVDEKFVNNDLKQFYKKGSTTWNELKSKAEDYGWKQLDDLFDRAANKGDKDAKMKLFDLISRDQVISYNNPTATGGIVIENTPKNRLPTWKQWIATYAPDEKGLRIIDVAAKSSSTSATKNPTDVYSLMHNYDLAAQGHTELIPQIADALNSGKVKDDQGKNTITGRDTIAWWWISKDSALDKLLTNEGVDRTKLTYGQLLDRISGESKLNLESTMTSLGDHLTALKGYINPMLIPGSPGGTGMSVVQNMEGFLKHFDGNNPDSALSRINEEYKGVANDLRELAKKAVNTNSPTVKKFMEKANNDLAEIHRRTVQFIDSASDYMDKGVHNMKDIKNAEEKAKSMAIISAVFSALGGLGIGGLMFSAGATSVRTAASITKGQWLLEKIPQMAGLTTLGANLFASTHVNRDKAQAAQEAIDKMGKNIEKYGQSSAAIRKVFDEGVNKDMVKAFDRLAQTTASTDWYFFNDQRLKDYYLWVTDRNTDNKSKSSLFNKDADDSAYKGIMPYKTWKPGQFAGMNFDSPDFVEYFYKQINQENPIKPPWYKDL